VKSNQAYRVSTLCRTLGVSTSGYYAWLDREPSTRMQADLQLGDRIEAIHRQSRST
jgi:putative transposase